MATALFTKTRIQRLAGDCYVAPRNFCLFADCVIAHYLLRCIGVFISMHEEGGGLDRQSFVIRRKVEVNEAEYQMICAIRICANLKHAGILGHLVTRPHSTLEKRPRRS